MQWLDEYAYKAEERLDADGDLAKRVYSRLAERLIENGTGTALLFGTIKESTKYTMTSTGVGSYTEGILCPVSYLRRPCSQLVSEAL
jgi:hypothetical protein